MAWNNDDLTIYHGTTTQAFGLTWPCSLAQIGAAVAGFRASVAYSSRRADFSQGFYATSVPHQARQWANEGVRRLAARTPVVPAGAVVFEYAIERAALAAAQSLVFLLPSNDYFDFVRHCRRFPGHLRHDRSARAVGMPAPQDHYDVVFGPVSMGYQRLVIHGCDQISFHDQPLVNRVLGRPKLTIAATRRNGIIP